MVEKIRIDKLLSNLGYCTRSNVKQWVIQNKGNIIINDTEVTTLNLSSKVDPKEVIIHGEKIHAIPPIIVNKPEGFICSRKREEKEVKIIFDLLPEKFLSLKNPVLSIAGRLDKFASGLVILSQDGDLVNKIISPIKKHRKKVLPKVYEVTTFFPFSGKEISIFNSREILLKNEKYPLQPVNFEIIDPSQNKAKLTLYEGRYHQIVRMFYHIGNKVKTINRIQIGPISLNNLKIGEWRYLTPEEVLKLQNKNYYNFS
jgi:16S rRNA pseudouridine516 synthase